MDIFDVTLCPEKKKLLNKFKHMLIVNVLAFRKLKQNLIIFNRSPRNTFSKLSVFWQNYWFLKIFDDVSKKWQPFWIFFYFILFLLSTAISVASFVAIALVVWKILRGGRFSPPPQCYRAPERPSIYRVNGTIYPLKFSSCL